MEIKVELDDEMVKMLTHVQDAFRAGEQKINWDLWTFDKILLGAFKIQFAQAYADAEQACVEALEAFEGQIQ